MARGKSGMTAAWWWIDRWRKSSAYVEMTAEEQGVYRNLLDELWLRGGVLPLSEKALAQASGDYEAWMRCREAVLERFERTPEGYRHETHDEVYEQSARRARNQKAYRERKVSHDNASDNASDNTSDNDPDNKPASPSPSPSQSQRAPLTPQGDRPKTAGDGDSSTSNGRPNPRDLETLEWLADAWNRSTEETGLPTVSARSLRSGRGMLSRARELRGAAKERGLDPKVAAGAVASYLAELYSQMDREGKGRWGLRNALGVTKWMGHVDKALSSTNGQTAFLRDKQGCAIWPRDGGPLPEADPDTLRAFLAAGPNDTYRAAVEEILEKHDAES